MHGRTNIVKDMTQQPQEITQFADNAVVAVAEHVGGPRIVANPYVTEDVLRWLCRPRNIATITWTSSQVSGTRIGTLSLPWELFKN
eukprot:TRINITY_DN12002_c0_g1_i1.p1 TRINITY_DN12002_c0_g1~~TRINITY_DN12002_c0_g1_i1.p1  ORF type:complete len:86 (-),score=12.13 TRINITY_DN12002_c0_g1_i1:24-281(-)